jgi:PAS domain S-box-containing protein
MSKSTDAPNGEGSGLAAERLAAIVSSSDDAIVSKDLEGVVTSWNAGATRIFGYEANEMIGQPITRIIPPELHPEEDRILAQLRRGQRVDHYETERVAKDGRRIAISLTVSPLRDKSGEVIGASKVARDITGRKLAEARQKLLIDELNHRVKNMLATVQAIANQTLRRTKDPSAFVEALTGRLHSLALVHSMLSVSAWQGAELRDLIRDQLLQGPVDESRLSVWGPLVRLEPQMALHFALMIYELGTNACKYGSLSVPDGRVMIDWVVRDRVLHLRWAETGGPIVSTPTTRGFGTTLVERSAKSHGGSAQMMCSPGGIIWKISLPLPPAADSGKPAADDLGTGSLPQHRLPAEKKLSTKFQGKQFLIVEDEPNIGGMIADWLEELGVEVIGPAGTTKEAQRLIESTTTLDGALLDVNLDGESIEDVAAALNRRNVPIGFVTGYGREGVPRGFEAAPMIGKPFTQAQLIELLGRLVDRPNNAVRLRPKGQ